MHKTLDKTEEKDDSITTTSRGSTAFTFFKPSSGPSPTIRILGFRNFIPAFDVKVPEEDTKSVRESRNFDIVKLDGSPLVIKLDKKFEDTVRAPTIQAFESGPFILFTYSESIRNGHFKTVQSLETVRVKFSHNSTCYDDDLLLNEEDLLLVEVGETECVYIVPKEHFAKKMQFYAVPEELADNFPFESLKNRISTVSATFAKKPLLREEDLIRLGVVSKGVFGECYRSFYKEKKRYYGISEVVIKAPEVLAIILQELDVLEKISQSSHPELNSVVSLQLIEQEEFEPLKLKIISDLGVGTLEEFSLFKNHNKEEWKEEELLKALAELLRQYRIFSELKISIRDIRPSNIVLCKESKRLRFLDLSLGSLCVENSSISEIAGVPKYMASEFVNNLEQMTLTKHDTFLADLYSIGATIAELMNNNGQIEQKGSLSEQTKDIIREKHPILWERFLGKLLESEPLNRKEAIYAVKQSTEEPLLTEQSNRAFESYIAEKELPARKELFSDYDTFLSYFWDLENFSLIERMDKEIIEKFNTTGNSLRKVTRFSQKLAALYENKQMWEKAIGMYERLADILEAEKNRKVDDGNETEENNYQDHDDLLLELYSKIGSIYKAQKSYNKALEYYEKALYFEYLKDPEDKIYDFKNHIEIAEVYEELGQSDLALDTYTKVQERFKQSFGNRANQLQEGILFERIAGLYYRRNEFLSAIEEAERAIESYTTCYGKHHISVGNCERLLGDIYKKIGDLEEAMKHYEIYFANHFHGPNKHDIGPVKIIEEIGDYYKGKSQYNEAVENYQRSINLYQYQDDENALCVLYEKLAECYTLQKKFILAVKTLKTCYKLKVSSLGENSLELVPIIEKIANNYVKDGETNEALKEYSRALSISMIYKSNDDPLVADILKKIGAISPLAFLAYKNYKRTSTGMSLGSRNTLSKSQIPILISFNKIEDVRGVLGGIDFNVSLYELRELISKECTYLGFFKYNFLREGKLVDILGEKLVKLEECIIKKDGFNHLVIQEGKNVARERMTF